MTHAYYDEIFPDMSSSSQGNIGRRSRSSRLSDWPAAYIIAELRLRGWSLRKLSAAHGLGPTRLSDVFRQSFPKGEAIIAEVLGIPAFTLWPSRYNKQSGEGKVAS